MNQKLEFIGISGPTHGFPNVPPFVWSLSDFNNNTNHFCGLLMCNNEEYGYDGMSYSRLKKMKWKDLLNSSVNFSFEGSTDINNKTIQWNFMKGYQMLVYYRIK